MSQTYIEADVSGQPEQLELALASISDALIIEGVEELDGYLKFYFKKEDFNIELFKKLVEVIGIKYSLSTINDRNWNAVWEENFHPVVVDDFVYIRAGFHAPAPGGILFELVITPKMSFGTGHHATTFMMLAAMRHYPFAGRSVIDFGTGTGILAIMAGKLGAAKIEAIDYDEWSIENARENFARNQCSGIELLQGDQFPGSGKYDIILANINRNIIVDNFEKMANALNTGGILLLSGLLMDDRAEIVAIAEKYDLKLNTAQEKNNWICIAFTN